MPIPKVEVESEVSAPNLHSRVGNRLDRWTNRGNRVCPFFVLVLLLIVVLRRKRRDRGNGIGIEGDR
jgi:hypothetical protein